MGDSLQGGAIRKNPRSKTHHRLVSFVCFCKIGFEIGVEAPLLPYHFTVSRYFLLCGICSAAVGDSSSRK